MDKNTLINTISKQIDETFKELDLVRSDIVIEKQKLISLTLEYSDLSKDIAKTKKEIEDRLIGLSKSENALRLEQENFNSEVEKFKANRLVIEQDLQGKVESRWKIEGEISELQKTLSSLETRVKAKEVLSGELDSISKLVVEKSNELKRLSEEAIESKKEIEKAKKIAEKELESINKDIEKRREVVVPTIKELEEREKAVKEREDGVDTIVERYKRLYADKGAGFKV